MHGKAVNLVLSVCFQNEQRNSEVPFTTCFSKVLHGMTGDGKNGTLICFLIKSGFVKALYFDFRYSILKQEKFTNILVLMCNIKDTIKTIDFF